ncbi:Predicted nucleic acid-binding protein, contains PIN domain [Anaerosporobacter mobilis DSM 15930]|uniref:Predicted nucleic acid-binding protein, contains PIN domain n=1 Tax=Anaerosporobacter mobilis DSM 15930 TaxID=1120996 RepID=A0A1M7MXF4_9FIRM|nr:type II toxin-antitoxin system VapC family toxin [Anaerosporobacter mobilis]SHM95301.1 Predicted nucleic acid-binding protein, contains PIN domain [Anaerosporobacter mobilis DSM 15930]
MEKNKIDIKKFSPTKNDKFIFDTNVLINLFYPLDFKNHTNTESYAKLWEEINARNLKVLITSIQLSEFINRCIRFQYNLYQEDINRQIEYKREYRETENYRECMTDILQVVEDQICKRFDFIDDGFSKMDKKKIFVYGFSYDFNDALLVQVAKQNEAILVTDDADYANYSEPVKIVTTNRKLLMFT